jgi:hypothetical protein
MGDPLVPADDANPKGYYEDMEMHHLNRQFVRGHLPFPNWFHATQRMLSARDRRSPWGFKIGGLPYLLGIYFCFLPEMKIIRVLRNMDLVIKSYANWWGENYTEELARKVVKGKMVSLNRLLKNKDHLVIRFGKGRKSDEEIIEQIENKWGN